MKVKRDFIFDPSLVLYLPLYQLDGSPIMSKDAYGHLGTVTGALWRLDGRYFDGTDDRIDCGKPSALTFAQGTIIVWANSADWSTQESVIVFLVTSANSYDRLELGWRKTNNFFQGIINTDIGSYQVNSSSAPTDNVFCQVAVTFEGTNLRIYYNASLENTTATSGTIVTPAGNLHIGGRDAANNFTGKIGEVIIYNRALNADEITYLYNMTKWRYL